MAGTPYGAAQRVVVAEILDEDEASVGRANAVLQGATRITMLCGPALGGILIAAVGAPVVLVVDAASYVIAFVLVTLFVPVAGAVQEEEPEDARGLLAGVRYLLRDPLMRGWTTAIVVGDASFSVIFVAIPVLVFAHYGADPRLAGAFLASWGVGAVAGNVVASGATASAGFARPRRSCSSRPPRSGRSPPGARGCRRGRARALRDRERARQPDAACVSHAAAPTAVRAKALTATFTASTLGTPLALAVAALAFPVYGSRHVVAFAATGQLAAMSYAAVITLRYLARERA